MKPLAKFFTLLIAIPVALITILLQSVRGTAFARGGDPAHFDPNSAMGGGGRLGGRPSTTTAPTTTTAPATKPATTPTTNQ